jgi:hypothetical protein
MALYAIKATLNGDGSAVAVVAADKITGATAPEATVAADVATLVADGASPTQGHVNTLNTDWTSLKTVIDAQASGALGGVTVIIDLAVITNLNKLDAALAAIKFAARGPALSPGIVTG